MKKLIALGLITICLLSFGFAGCKQKENNSDTAKLETVEIGEGKKSFNLTVEADGSQKAYLVKTDKKTVADALLELKLIEAEKGNPGIYIRKVDGISADFELDRSYWAFYINGQYATSGADSTDITEGEKYAFKKEKA